MTRKPSQLLRNECAGALRCAEPGERMVERTGEIEDARAPGHEVEIQDRDDPIITHERVAEAQVAMDELPWQLWVGSKAVLPEMFDKLPGDAANGVGAGKVRVIRTGREGGVRFVQPGKSFRDIGMGGVGWLRQDSGIDRGKRIMEWRERGEDMTGVLAGFLNRIGDNGFRHLDEAIVFRTVTSRSCRVAGNGDEGLAGGGSHYGRDGDAVRPEPVLHGMNGLQPCGIGRWTMYADDQIADVRLDPGDSVDGTTKGYDLTGGKRPAIRIGE